MTSKRILWLALILTGATRGSIASDARCAEHRRYTAGGWNVVETANFRFCSRGPLALTDKTLRATETLRTQLIGKWSGSSSQAGDWQPKCDVMLHGTPAAYLRSVPGGAQTLGSSLIDVANNAVVGRRIDIRADQPGWFDAALGHELTHLVLADLFADCQVPAWADEGMAVLADPSGKQDRHFRDLWLAQSQQASFRLAELFALDGYPSPDRQAAFYGQSASLVQYLVERGTPEQFVQFVRTGAAGGYEQALRDIYRLNGVSDLERRWRQHMMAVGAVALRERRLSVD